jgi:glycosyltransferase involved in cell wall biosynthesis
MKLHFIQDEATPHNNLLIKELLDSYDFDLNLFYSRSDSELYNWSVNPINETKKASVFGYHSINWRVVWVLLRCRKDVVFQVGWSNPTTKTLILLFWIFKRPYNMWFDLPNDDESRGFIKKKSREVFYQILRRSQVNIFCVGKMTVAYFKRRGFDKGVLFNLPIAVNSSKLLVNDKSTFYNKIQYQYKISNKDFVILAGSRLTHKKGYDLLIKALSMLPYELKKNIKTIIVGRGEEKDNLLLQIKMLGLVDSVFIEEWMDIEEFRDCVRHASVFSHPARFDPYGGSILALSLGIPVIGSNGAGAAVDCVNHGKNGFLYPFEDVHRLTYLITQLYKKPTLRKEMAIEAYKSSLEWSPSHCAKTFIENMRNV